MASDPFVVWERLIVKAGIRYSKNPIESPVTYWLSVAMDGGWKAPNGPLPAPGPTLRGWRRYYVTIDGFEFRFASLEELVYAAEILSQKNLPPSTPNGHWLSRLPCWVKPWRFRQKAVRGLQTALKQFLKTPDDAAAATDPFEARTLRRAKRSMTSVLELELKRKKDQRTAIDQFTHRPSDRRARRRLRG